MATPSKMPLRGAYVIQPRADDQLAVKLGIFDWHLRDSKVSAPAAQERLAQRIHEFQDELLENLSALDENSEVIDRIRYYMNASEDIFIKGCVRENPSPSVADKELDYLLNNFVTRDLADKLSKELKYYTITSLLASVAFASVGYQCKYSSAMQNSDLVGTYCFVAAASMIGVIVSNLSVPYVSKLSDAYNKRKLLSSPILRIVGTAASAVALAIAFRYEVVTIKFGKFDVNQIETDLKVALFVGFIGGIASSNLIKLLIELAKKISK